MGQSSVVALFSFLYFISRVPNILMSNGASSADFLAHDGMQLAGHPPNKCRVGRRVDRAREIFHLAGVAHEVVQGYVARRI
jgi:hypothetical protein